MYWVRTRCLGSWYVLHCKESIIMTSYQPSLSTLVLYWQMMACGCGSDPAQWGPYKKWWSLNSISFISNIRGKTVNLSSLVQGFWEILRPERKHLWVMLNVKCLMLTLMFIFIWNICFSLVKGSEACNKHYLNCKFIVLLILSRVIALLGSM